MDQGLGRRGGGGGGAWKVYHWWGKGRDGVGFREELSKVVHCPPSLTGGVVGVG